MNLAFEKPRKAPRHPALQGLTDKELVFVYNTASVKKFDTGHVIIQNGDTDTALYLILEGSAQILKSLNGHIRQVAVRGPGDWLPEAPLFERQETKASAVALEPMTAFVLDEDTLNTLPLKIQLAIYKRLNDLSAERINDLIQKGLELSDKNQYLISNVAQFLHAGSDGYARSDMIASFLQSVPRLPMYASRLAVMLLDENVSTRKVAELAKQDPSLVGAVLKTVNSAYYAFQSKVSDFQHAVLLLGFNQVYQLVMDMGIRHTMPKTSEFRELQFHSMVVSLIGFEISQLCNVKKAVVVSTIGLLHDIGKSVILLLKRRHSKMSVLIDTLDHPKIGSLLLKEWNIPDEVSQSLQYQCYPEWLPPERIPKEWRENVTALYIAHLCHDYLGGKSENDLSTAFLGEYLYTLNLPERSIAELVQNKVLPALNKKLNTFPEDVRHFLTRNLNHMVDKGQGDASKV
jgi:HD-like signal output (HDOD) protein